MKWLMQLVALTLVIIAGTWFAGWWVVPLAGAAFGAWTSATRTTVLTATLAGALGWGALLAFDAYAGPVGRLLDVFGSLFRLPSGALVVLTVAYAALLCASAAAVSRGIRRLLAPA